MLFRSVPSDEEWKELEMCLGMTQAEADKIASFRGTDEGGKLKEAGTSHWNNPNRGATNASGFSALPCGYRVDGGTCGSIGNGGEWWSSSEYKITGAWDRDLHDLNATISRFNTDKEYGFSVRCVKDK